MTNKELREKIEEILTHKVWLEEQRDYLLSLTKEYALSVLPEERSWKKQKAKSGLMWNDGFNKAIKQAKENIK